MSLEVLRSCQKEISRILPHRSIFLLWDVTLPSVGLAPTVNMTDVLDQAASTLVSPPASAHDASGSSPPDARVTPTRSDSRSRASSPSQSRHLQRYTPESGPIRKSSRTPSQQQSAEHETQTIKKRRSVSIPQADEESLKLIKELQAQDLGLRRRGKV